MTSKVALSGVKAKERVAWDRESCRGTTSASTRKPKEWCPLILYLGKGGK
jgi:hypothetical protein